ncbi:MAG: hypothetical protein E5Y79_28400 [Mesorhizobium sp.]|uniref:hypothetical protein n=1 Tax=Mesorhizobium sp. TaxID=1871066 RepID=UPI0011FA0AA1|nr:hypothetical protein [Mesorhizobium sp.]TIL56728.1 MAG: hypothetical protein E5Y79_28400 [Mesorhizobium sp.]
MTADEAGTSRADNDNTPVFDRGRELPRLVEPLTEWAPPHVFAKMRGKPVFRYGADGPSIGHRLSAQAAWTTSGRYSGQHANDNKDWPLAKLLRAENNEHCLALAERYRAMYDAASEPTELVGKDLADNIYLMADMRLDESTGSLENKGPKKVTGKKARLDFQATRAVAADPDRAKRRARPVTRRWNGDWPLLHAIDCRRELAAAQSALGWLREAFEAACVGGETLETIGRAHGVGNQAGAKGAGRAMVFLGLQCLDEFWKRPARRVASSGLGRQI